MPPKRDPEKSPKDPIRNRGGNELHPPVPGNGDNGDGGNGDNNTPANNNDDAPQGPFKDRPRPFAVLRQEKARTTAKTEEANEKRKEADAKVTAAQEQVAEELTKYKKSLDENGEARLKVHKTTVDKLSQEVAVVKSEVEALEKQLAAARKKHANSVDSLNKAQNELTAEERKIQKENEQSVKKRGEELNTSVAAAKKEQAEIYKETDKEISEEKRHTLTRTFSEAIAFVPDLTMRFVHAGLRSLREVFSVFSRAAHGAKEGYKEPTLFSKTREEPVVPPGKQQPTGKSANAAKSSAPQKG